MLNLLKIIVKTWSRIFRKDQSMHSPNPINKVTSPTMAKSKGNLEKCNLSRMQQFHSRPWRFQNVVVPHPRAAVPHLGRTAKLPRPSRYNFNQRRHPSLASSARRRVTM